LWNGFTTRRMAAECWYRLQSDGLKLIDKALTAHMQVEKRMLTSFSLKDREKFAELLRTLTQDLEITLQPAISAPLS
jgi:hypothetical protein